MNTLDKNPWKVDSIQDFSCLKCPECIFFAKEQNYFEDHAIANHPLSAILFDEIMSSYEIEDNFKEELLDEINHVNVGDIKKEPTDQDTSEDPFDICDTNIKQEDENVISSSPNKHVVSDNELSLNHENKPKKQKMEQREVRIVVFNSSQHVTPSEKMINYQNSSVVATSIKELKKQSDVHETPIPVIPENKPKIRQRKQKISVRNEVALEKDQQISIIAIRDTIEKKTFSCGIRNKTFDKKCDFSIDSELELTKHITSVHCGKVIQAKERSFKCPKCNFKTKNQHNFDMHIKSKKSHLQRKQRIRQSSLKCPDCTFEATTQHNLDVHIKGHYNCEHCGQTFVGGQAKRNFTRHLKKHTKQPKVYPTCKMCNKVYKYQSEVKKHQTACFYKQMQQKGNNV